MANEKILNTRIRLKYDSYKEWVEKNPTLLSGEVAIAYLPPRSDIEHTNPAPAAVASATLIKVGPGEFNTLPWLSATAADVYDWAKKTESEFTAWVKTLVDVSDIDLSNYYNKNEVDGLIEAVDTGVMVVTTGTTNGTIAVDGTDVAVFGLGSAAYTNSDAYATASQGALADTAIQPTDIVDMATTNDVATAKQEAVKDAADAAALIYKTEDEIKTIAATEINRLIGAADDEGGETIQSIANLVDYVEKNAGEIAGLVTDVGTANTNASNAVNIANAASEVANAASGVANEAKELAQSAKETAETAQSSAAASATAAAGSASAAADSASTAESHANTASAKAGEASASATNADNAKIAAEAAQVKAEEAQSAAESAHDEAAQAKVDAEAAKNAAITSATTANTKANEADSSAKAAAESARLAGVSETNAAASAAAAEAAKQAALDSNTSATAIANEAKNTADAAKTASDAATEAVAGLHAIATSGSLYDAEEVNNGTNDTKYFVFYCGTASELVD